MPMRYEIHDQHSFVYLEAEGVVTDEELLHTLGRVFGHTAVAERARLLLDARHASAVGITSAGVARMVDLSERVGPDQARTAVVSSDPVIRGMTRMYELRRGDTQGRREVVLFEEVDRAMEWLDVPAEAVATLARKES